MCNDTVCGLAWHWAAGSRGFFRPCWPMSDGFQAASWMAAQGRHCQFAAYESCRSGCLVHCVQRVSGLRRTAASTQTTSQRLVSAAAVTGLPKLSGGSQPEAVTGRKTVDDCSWPFPVIRTGAAPSSETFA